MKTEKLANVIFLAGLLFMWVFLFTFTAIDQDTKYYCLNSWDFYPQDQAGVYMVHGRFVELEGEARPGMWRVYKGVGRYDGMCDGMVTK